MRESNVNWRITAGQALILENRANCDTRVTARVTRARQGTLQVNARKGARGDIRRRARALRLSRNWRIRQKRSAWRHALQRNRVTRRLYFGRQRPYRLHQHRAHWPICHRAARFWLRARRRAVATPALCAPAPRRRRRARQCPHTPDCPHAGASRYPG